MIKTKLFYYSDNIHSWSSPVLLLLQKGLTIPPNANQKQAKALDTGTPEQARLWSDLDFQIHNLEAT